MWRVSPVEKMLTEELGFSKIVKGYFVLAHTSASGLEREIFASVSKEWTTLNGDICLESEVSAEDVFKINSEFALGLYLKGLKKKRYAIQKTLRNAQVTTGEFRSSIELVRDVIDGMQEDLHKELGILFDNSKIPIKLKWKYQWQFAEFLKFATDLHHLYFHWDKDFIRMSALENSELEIISTKAFSKDIGKVAQNFEKTSDGRYRLSLPISEVKKERIAYYLIGKLFEGVDIPELEVVQKNQASDRMNVYFSRRLPKFEPRRGSTGLVGSGSRSSSRTSFSEVASRSTIPNVLPPVLIAKSIAVDEAKEAWQDFEWPF